MLSSGCIYQRSYKLLPPGNKRLILLIFYNDSSCSVSTTRHKCDTTKLRPLSQTNKLGNFKPMPFFSILLCEPVQFIAILRQISCCFFMLYLFTRYCVCIFIYKKQVVIYKRRLLQGSMQTLEKLNIPHDLVAWSLLHDCGTLFCTKLLEFIAICMHLFMHSHNPGTWFPSGWSLGLTGPFFSFPAILL